MEGRGLKADDELLPESVSTLPIANIIKAIRPTIEITILDEFFLIVFLL